MGRSAAAPAGLGASASLGHEHDWPLAPAGWDKLVTCRTCGLLLLRGFIGSARWVVRRVESIDFVDDRTVRRRVSVDYTVPDDAVTLRVSDKATIRILPLALMRRKNMVKFDFRDHDGRPIPLLGLRENQALTLAVVRAWADATLESSARLEWPRLPGDLANLLDDVIAGEQKDLDAAYSELERRQKERPPGVNKYLMALLERLASNFVLFGSEPGEPGTRRIVKWSYDEPLTLLHSTTGYQGYASGPCPGEPNSEDGKPAYGKTGVDQPWWKANPLRAGLGLQPTLIRFPTPGAELAASFHVEVTAPPEVSIVQASMLAGTPNLRFDADPETDRQQYDYLRGRFPDSPRSARAPRRPSFDSVGGGYPTVDLHVADVPYGSLSRAQVEMQASPAGWLSGAWLVTLLATATLTVAWVSRPPETQAAELPTLVLISFAAAMVAVVLRPDPHVMVTRLLSRLRMLAAVSAVLVLASGCAFAFLGAASARPWIAGMAVLSTGPAAVLTAVWWLARRRLVRDRPPGRRAAERRREKANVGRFAERYAQASTHSERRSVLKARRTAPLIRLSPWEQHLPGADHDPYVDNEFAAELAGILDRADFPYDEAIVQLAFNRPGIKVASLEGDRSAFPWTVDFEAQFWRLLDEGIARCGSSEASAAT